MCYSSINKLYGHISDDTVRTDGRRIRAFDSWCKIQIKMEVENDKLIGPGYSEYGGTRLRRMEDVMGNRLFQ